ncbi:hypothetical protein GA0074692_3770 [Micromonospora pallida]|uniref:Uncharacterized protein n=1 Tax=Micromonospora pallida TaxID=145854 RepID=A0A1C6SXB9_9ACTN|nr:hypothetical protein [Micromonospora pallida]SCL34201.1 hypothetical protein GA0074692_3770 [Micromonospora pallida]
MSAAPTVACPECAGTGCPRCQWQGRRHAQLLLTVANRDTGEVASRRVMPADLDPRPAPAGGWVAELTPWVRDLAATVAAALDPDPLVVRLPPTWRPDLPAADRYALAADALADAARHPWRLWLGRSAVPSPVDPDARLAQLCGLADLLLLDLVVAVRRDGDVAHWTVRYDVPGSPVPDGPVEGSPDLATALLRTDVPAALAGLADRGLTAPARLLGTGRLTAGGPGDPDLRPGDPDLRPGDPDLRPGGDVPTVRRLPPQTGPVHRIERRVLAELVEPTGGDPRGVGHVGVSSPADTPTCRSSRRSPDRGRPDRTDGPGAEAVWRDGGWWRTGLRYTVDGAPGRSALSVGGRPRPSLHRVVEPPDPSRSREPVSGRPCPDCRSPELTRACRCASGGGPAGDCGRCGGTGRRRSALRCATCGGTRRLCRTVLVTLTDLRHRVVHLTWHAGAPEVACAVASASGGRPVVQLPERYRLGAWARVFGVRPEDLAEADGGHAIPRELRDGYVTLPWPGADPVGEYVREVGRGLPAGRLVVSAVRPDVPPLVELIRLGVGLDLALHVSLLDLRKHAGHPLRPDGRYWSVEVRHRDAPVHPADLPTRPSLAAALDECLTHLADDLAGLLSADPGVPLPVPCSPARESVADPVPVLLRLAAEYGGRAVTLRFTRAGHTARLHDDDGVRPVNLPCVV